jgi:hypothetical protein
MSLLSTRQTDAAELLNDWTKADTEARCPLGHHEYCANSDRGRKRKLETIRTKQNKSCNRKADRASRHNTGFEHPYDMKTMWAESQQITDYQRSTGVGKRARRLKARSK